MLSLFDDVSQLPENPLAIFYPESIRPISSHLRSLIASEIHRPNSFEGLVPTVVPQIIGFLETIHLMHERALSLLVEHCHNGAQFCLFLRTFSAAGFGSNNISYHGSSATQQQGWSGGDQELREFLTSHLAGVLPVISCLNTLEVYTVAHAQKNLEDPPAVLRLLSHNWKRTIAALVDGAQSIVLYCEATLHGEILQGIQFEMGLLHQLRQTERCIYLIHTHCRVPRTGKFDFHAAFAWPGTRTSTRNFLRQLKAMAKDGSRRLTKFRDFRGLCCHVIDRGIERAFEQYHVMHLSKMKYENFIPHALVNNLKLASSQYMEMVKRWQAVDI